MDGAFDRAPRYAIGFEALEMLNADVAKKLWTSAKAKK
jgi:hypothetical protein